MKFTDRFFKFDISKLDLRPFWISLVCGLILALFQRYSREVPIVLKPFPIHAGAENYDSYKTILKKIGLKENNYALSHDSLLPQNPGGDLRLASSYIAVDFESGKVVAEKDSRKRLPVASLAKIMTAVVALDPTDGLEMFTVSKEASEMLPTRAGMTAGQRLTVNELLHALLLTSANDAAQVLKEGVDNLYGSGFFLRAMNDKAGYLKLGDTRFGNPQGFDDEISYSTASDLAILSYYALTNYPQISEIVRKDYQFIPGTADHKQMDLYNWNGLLGVYPGILGIKIGNTRNAGYTTVVLSERAGKKILAVVLGAPGVLERDLWAGRLLDYGFRKEWGLSPVNVKKRELEDKYGTWEYWN